MMPREEYYLKEELRRQKRQLEYLERELKNPAGIKEGALTDREKMVLHFCCSMTIAKMTGVANHKAIIEKMVEDIRNNRCRSLSTEDVIDLLDEVNEEMVSGKIMLQHLTDEMKWSMTGERPNKNTNWRDMR